MLRTTVELVPFVEEDGKQVLHTIYIGNVGGGREFGNYHIWIDKDPRVMPRPEPMANINYYPRIKGAVMLTLKCIEALEKNGHVKDFNP